MIAEQDPLDRFVRTAWRWVAFIAVTLAVSGTSSPELTADAPCPPWRAN
jgi:hypothetical protein